MSGLNLNLHEINYYEPKKPNLDEYVLCRECRDFVYEYCSLHGPLLVLPDDKVLTGTNIPSQVPHAALTIPSAFLHLAPSGIPGAGIGVFSSLPLPAGIRLGPYRGNETNAVQSAYCWQIYDKCNRPSQVVDAADAGRSNWMRYVNCSRHWSEQNLLAYQYKGQVYYRTIKMIPQYTELLVFYGSESANALNVDLKLYNAPPQFYYENISQVPTDIELNKNQFPLNSDQIQLKADIFKDNDNKVYIDMSSERNSTQKIGINFINEFESKEKINNEYRQNTNKNIKAETINITTKEFEPNESDREFSTKDVLTDPLPKHINATHTFVSDQRTKHMSEMLNCDICPFKTNQQRYIISHLKVHKLTKVFSCDVCAYKCSCESKLQRHIKIHTNEKPFSYSGFGGTVKFGRKGHIRTQSKHFSCELCQYRSKQKSKLKEHVRTHTGEKPFACNVCEYRGAKQGTLKRHLRTHNERNC